MASDGRLRIFDALGIALAAAGGVMIFLGWYSIHDKASVLEQIPYLASGSVGGLAAIIGGVSIVYLTRQFRLEREVGRLSAMQEEMAAAVRSLAADHGTSAPPVTGLHRRGGRLDRVEQLSIKEQSR
ncbi:MAG: hypothetical protein AB1679_11035 [Actinomycetota bacterium]